MKITTINTIETSSVCDNQCAYCPAPIQGQHRAIGHMTIETYKKALVWLKHCVQAGTQRELNLHGIGEPTLNTNLPEMIRLAREITPGIINFNTNGNSLTEGSIIAYKEAGITSINLTAHEPKRIMDKKKLLAKHGIPCDVNIDFATNPNNWGDQIKWTEKVDYTFKCDWLGRGQCMITWDGKVTPCCLDAFGAGVCGTIDEDIDKVEVKSFSLCKTCHHERPFI